MSSIIKLTKGKVAIIDKEDFKYLNQWKWYYDKNGYAKRKVNKKTIYMHRLINRTSNNLQTDHINRNKLDNKKSNLRTATRNTNQRNQNIDKTNTSGYKGISWSKVMNKWEVFIFKNNRKINLGYFKDIKEAYIKRKLGEKLYWEL